jgi:hypothetical protein
LYAILKRISVHEKINSPNYAESEQLKLETSELLRESAGIFDFIFNHICPKFTINSTDIQERNYFPELFPETFQLLA